MIRAHLVLAVMYLFISLGGNSQGIQVSSSPGSQIVVQGGVTTFQISLTPSGGFNQQVFLSTTSDVSSSLNISFSANNIFYPYDSGTVMTVGVTGSASLGLHWIAVNAGNGPVNGIDTVFLSITKDSCTWYTPATPPGFEFGSSLTHIVIDSSGTVWTGGWNLSEFDGSWTVYTNSNSSLPPSDVNDLCMGPGNLVWIATNSGLASFDGVYWTIYDSTNSALTTNRIASIDIDPSGILWAGTDIGVFTKSGNTWTNVSSGLISDPVVKLRIDKAGNVYVMTSNSGITEFSVFKSGAWSALANLNALFSSNEKTIGDFAIDTLGNLWMVSDNCNSNLGLIKYNGSAIERVYDKTD